MKKTLFVVLSLLVGGQIFAQENKWSFAPSVGINLTSISTQHDVTPRVGFDAGVMFQYRISDYIALEGGLRFSNQNAKYKVLFVGDNDEVFTKNYEASYGFLNVPVIIKGYIMRNNINGLNIFVGPQVNFALYADGKIDGVKKDFMPATRNTTITALIGVGYDFNCGFTLSLSQELPFSSINTGGYADLNSVSKLNTTSLRVGWRF